jgi:hypothetical protein
LPFRGKFQVRLWKCWWKIRFAKTNEVEQVAALSAASVTLESLRGDADKARLAEATFCHSAAGDFRYSLYRQYDRHSGLTGRHLLLVLFEISLNTALQVNLDKRSKDFI